MNHLIAPKRNVFSLAAAAAVILAVVVVVVPSRAADPAAPSADGWTPLFNGTDTTGWKFRQPEFAQAWRVVADVKLDPTDPKKLAGEGEAQSGVGVLLRGPAEHGSDILTEAELGDVELSVDVMVPKSSNSGVYLMGRYEVQVLDSHGKEKLGPGDMGGIYNTQAPSGANASKAPGEWQTLRVVFRAPRFDADGKKTENAKFVLVELNGTKIQENVEAPKPTGGELPGGEVAKGPLMFQGDHGIVAFRNVKYKAIEGGARAK